MQVAELLSDLKSLQVCEPNAALALVSARPQGQNDKADSATANGNNGDRDLRRAKDLIELHSTVKMAHQDGTERDLNQARDDVDEVLRTL